MRVYHLLGGGVSMSRMTIKNNDGSYSALAFGYEDGVAEEERHFKDVIQKLGQYEDICDDPSVLIDMFRFDINYGVIKLS